MAVFVLAAAAAGASTSATALHANHIYWAREYPLAFWQQRLDWMLRPRVIDRSGEMAGFVPPADSRDLDAAHAAAPGAIAETCVDLVIAREDSHAGRWWRHILGVDVLAIPRVIGSGQPRYRSRRPRCRRRSG